MCLILVTLREKYCKHRYLNVGKYEYTCVLLYNAASEGVSTSSIVLHILACYCCLLTRNAMYSTLIKSPFIRCLEYPSIQRPRPHAVTHSWLRHQTEDCQDASADL